MKYTKIKVKPNLQWVLKMDQRSLKNKKEKIKIRRVKNNNNIN